MEPITTATVATSIDWTTIIITIISTVQAVLLGWFVYNQYTKNKKTDQDINREQLRQETELELLKERTKADNQNIAIIYNELHELLLESGADRVYIVQPHPPHDQHLISVTMEVSQKGVTTIRASVQNLPFADIPVMVKNLATNCFNMFATIEDFGDSKAQSIARINGIYQSAAKRMINSSGVWVGNLFVDYNSSTSISETKLKAFLKDHANTIQHILPEFK